MFDNICVEVNNRENCFVYLIKGSLIADMKKMPVFLILLICIPWKNNFVQGDMH